MGVPRQNFAYDFIHIDKASSRLTKFVNQFPFQGHACLPDVVSYTTSNLSNYESYERKPDLNVTMHLWPDDMHTRHVKY
ncbi:hypothetical protein MRX96_020817 [Rhipicephalus microplus]